MELKAGRAEEETWSLHLDACPNCNNPLHVRKSGMWPFAKPHAQVMCQSCGVSGPYVSIDSTTDAAWALTVNRAFDGWLTTARKICAQLDKPLRQRRKKKG